MTHALRIGAGFVGHAASDLTIADIVNAAARSEDAGLDSFWVGDQRWLRDPWIALTAIAEHTQRLAIGTRITDPYIRHPAVTAAAAATLDERSQGRFILGLGAGGSGFDQLSIVREDPVTAVREAVLLMRQLWNGDGSRMVGRIVQWKGGTLGFPTRADIPIVIASRGPKLLALAGEVADGAVIAAGTAPTAIRWATGHIQRGIDRGGRSPGDVELLHHTYMCVDDSKPARAIHAAKQAVAGAVIGSFPTFDFLGAAGLTIPSDLHGYLKSGKRDMDTIVELIPDQFVEGLAIAGSSSDAVDRLRSLVRAGIDHILVAMIAPLGENGLQQLDRILRRVLSKLR